jgi:hypothetical protein
MSAQLGRATLGAAQLGADRAGSFGGPIVGSAGIASAETFGAGGIVTGPIVGAAGIASQEAFGLGGIVLPLPLPPPPFVNTAQVFQYQSQSFFYYEPVP